MSTFTPSTQTSAVGTSHAIGDAVWQYMTSLKSVKKRDGSDEVFSPEKLERSIIAAMMAAGMKEHNLGVARQVVEHVVGRLTRVFDGHTTPSTADVREVINATLIDHNLVHVSKKFVSYRFENRHQDEAARYGHGITVKRYFTTPGKHPYELIKWESRTAKITNEKGRLFLSRKMLRCRSFGRRRLPTSWCKSISAAKSVSLTVNEAPNN